MRELIGNALAPINACLNFTALMLLIVGYRHVRAAKRAATPAEKQERLTAHERAMKLAFLTSTVFLISYLTRYWLTGSHRFPGTSTLRWIYLLILFSHMVLAAATVPLVLRTLQLARGKRFGDHRKIAKWTYPVWLYVSVTGVIVYVLLYHVAPLVQ